MNTRTDDLNKLEEGRDGGNIHAKRSLDRAYEKSKDDELEKGRRRLIDAQNRLREARRNGMPMKVAMLEAQVAQIEYQLERYGQDKYGR